MVVLAHIRIPVAPVAAEQVDLAVVVVTACRCQDQEVLQLQAKEMPGDQGQLLLLIMLVAVAVPVQLAAMLEPMVAMAEQEQHIQYLEHL